MSKDTNYIEDYLGRLADGDFTEDVSKALLSKKGTVGNIAALLQKLVVSLRNNSNALDSIANGDFELPGAARNDPLSARTVKVAEIAQKFEEESKFAFEAISSGSLTVRISADKLNGGWKAVAQKYNSFIDGTVSAASSIKNGLDRAAHGDYGSHLSISGAFSGTGASFDAFIRRLKLAGNQLESVKNGDLSGIEEYKSAIPDWSGDQLARNIVGIAQAVSSLEAVSAGSPAELTGSYGAIAGNFNQAVNTFRSGLDEVNRRLKLLEENDFSAAAADDADESSAICQSALDSAREISNRFIGLENCFTKLLSGDTSDLEEYSKIQKRGDHDKLLPALIQHIQNIQNFLSQLDLATTSTYAGFYDKNVDVSLYSGLYLKVASTLNNIMAAFGDRIQFIGSFMAAIGAGKLDMKLEGNFRGGFLVLANSLNNTIDSLSHIIEEISGSLLEMSKGNLDLKPIDAYSGEWGRMSSSFNTIVEGLNGLIGDIKTAAMQVSSSAEQVSKVSQELSQSSTEQASSVEELSATISEIAKQTSHNAENATTANSFVVNVRDSAESCKDEMSHMLTAMTQISESSNNISNIIKVINDIAFQTNILALNAAIEAARAGQYGKGFAVVAEEVRSLASRSAQAVQETTTQIDSSKEKVANGMHIAENVAKTLDQIVNEVNSSVKYFDDITAASNEQALAIVEIKQNLEQVSRVVQSTSASAEESAASSEELSSQAELLKKHVSNFALREKDNA